MAGTTSGGDLTNGVRTGVYGRTAFSAAPAGLGGQGVFGGAGGSTENTYASGFNFGVVGTGPDSGYGVFGYCPTGAGSTGVLGRADAGTGVVASSSTGISLCVRDGGRILQQLRATGAPTSGTFNVGEMIRDGLGDMYICTAGGTPGTWRKVTAQHPEYANAGGSINLLAHPIRLIDCVATARRSPTASRASPTSSRWTRRSPARWPTGCRSRPAPRASSATSPRPTHSAAGTPLCGRPAGGTRHVEHQLQHHLGAIANYFISALSTDGKLSVMSAFAATNLIVDIFGFVF